MYRNNIKVEGVTAGHVQGIAIDAQRKYMYYSFTTCLIKTDMAGNLIGSVKGIAGHLGCIAYNYDDGRIYGSLEYKHDGIGKGILKRLNNAIEINDGFYVAIFDVTKIDRMDMDAEKDGVMTAVYLDEVLKDYQADGHKYGCSGIDGLTFAPIPGECGKKFLYVAYGIYGDITREDNDHQVILRYDIDEWKVFEKALNQNCMHRQGPLKPESKYFVYTGNTRWGIQNLEYDETTQCMFAAVYEGEKEKFPNYPMYIIDLKKAATNCALDNLNVNGEVLHIAEFGKKDESTGIFGIDFPYGATGMISLGEGFFYFSRDFYDGKSWGTNIGLYKFDGKSFSEI